LDQWDCSRFFISFIFSLTDVHVCIDKINHLKIITPSIIFFICVYELFPAFLLQVEALRVLWNLVIISPPYH
jgi:hypothetical protein